MKFEKKLGEGWQKIIIDVCGSKRPEKGDEILIHQSHLHPDHVGLPGDLVDKRVIFKSPTVFIHDLEQIFRRAMRMGQIQIEEYTDVIELVHTSFSPSKQRWLRSKSYAHFFSGNILFIPECDEPAQVIKEYRPKVTILMVSRRSKRFLVTPTELEADYWVDNKKWYWEPREPNIIPKVLFSCTQEDKELFKRLKLNSVVISYK